MGEITITTEEYKELLKSKMRVEIFADFVNDSQFGIDRRECARYLGFELRSGEDDGVSG